MEVVRQQLETEVAACNTVIETLREEMPHERACSDRLADEFAEARKGERLLEAVRKR
jgi:hypothetical protein